MAIKIKPLHQICNVQSRYACSFGFKNLAIKSEGPGHVIECFLYYVCMEYGGRWWAYVERT
jgi:hypothetical protein